MGLHPFLDCFYLGLALSVLAQPGRRVARHRRQGREAREGIDNRDMVVLRDAAGDIERAVDLVASDAKDALDYVDAREAEAARKATDAQHRLNLIAALFLPISAVGSVLGVNLRSGLEGQKSDVLLGRSRDRFCHGLSRTRERGARRKSRALSQWLAKRPPPPRAQPPRQLQLLELQKHDTSEY